MFRTLRVILLALVAAHGSLALAAPPAKIVLPDNLATTATGKTVVGKSWLYLVIQPSDPAAISGKTFRVYLKNAGINAGGTFTPIGDIKPVTDPATVGVMLQRAWTLGDTEANISAIAQDLTNQWKTAGQLVPPTLPGKMAALVNRSNQSTNDAITLRQLAISHPAFRMPLGLAWGGPIAPAPGTLCTAEVRQLTPGGEDAGVVGRCEFTAGQATALVAPGKPVQVADLTAEGDLTVKLRWALPTNLRRQALQTVGFRVWRVPADATLPTQPTLAQVLAVPGSKQLSIAPILLSKLYSSGNPSSSPTDVSNFIADPTTFFFADDNGRDQTAPIVPTPASPPFLQKIGTPHPENTSYNYYVAALDWLKQPGALSTVGTGTAVRTLPPPVPSGLAVEEIAASNVSPTTAFRLTFDSNSNAAPAVSTQRYAIYRGGPGSTSLAQHSHLQPYPLLPPPSPAVSLNPQVTLPHTGDRITHNDTTLISTNRETETYWYSVRAIHDTVLGPVYSAPSPPIFATFKDRIGPVAPNGSWIADHQQAVIREVSYSASVPLEAGTFTPGKGRYTRIRVRRSDPEVLYAHTIIYDSRTLAFSIGPRIYFAPGENEIHIDDFWEDPNASNFSSARVFAVTCAGADSRLSYLAWREVTWGGAVAASTTHRTEIVFEGSTSTTTGLLPATVASSKMLIDPGVSSFTPSGYQVRATLPNSLHNGRTVIATITRSGFPARRVLGKVTTNYADFPDPDRQASAAPASYSLRVLRLYQNHAGTSPTANDLPPSWPPELLWPPLVDHQAHYAPGPGNSSSVSITLPLTLGTKEYRLYRQIDGGELSLIGEGIADAISTAQIIIADTPNQPVSGRVCYYAQLVDQSGNTSPLKQLDPCLDILAPAPVPVLNEPVPLGTTAGPQMKLDWFCPPNGVRRFLIRLVDLTTGTVVSSSAVAKRLPPSEAIYFNPAPPGQQGNSLPAGAIFATDLTAPMPGTGAPVAATSSHTATFNIELDHEYQVEIIAQGIRENDVKRSLPRKFTWKSPVASGAVAWPARPLPIVVRGADHVMNITASELRASNPRFAGAYATPNRNFDDQVTPVLVPIGVMPLTPNGFGSARLAPQAASQVGSYPQLIPNTSSNRYKGSQDPNAYLIPIFSSDSISKAVPILPAVLYRQIVSAQGLNTLQTGDLVQVSPLITKIAWRNESGRAGIVDPLIVTLNNHVNGSDQDASFWIPDTHPVIAGHTYRYFLVRFGDDHEIDQVIDCGAITISP
ncbi:hypothetical protein OKA04_03310 [Luteolibacter flavescens]|uniref:Uncharacterized protein n=1 Tax=Luteolibacter flavescens TaxID=1859460 RepID=A0ABT3FJK1_9BACT|nr:hypothetical protein [Luteolibacter flavescens]MCW1883741.1 hypothetical protein [Luteolibacter flavescens]